MYITATHSLTHSLPLLELMIIMYTTHAPREGRARERYGTVFITSSHHTQAAIHPAHVYLSIHRNDKPRPSPAQPSQPASKQTQAYKVVFVQAVRSIKFPLTHSLIHSMHGIPPTSILPQSDQQHVILPPTQKSPQSPIHQRYPFVIFPFMTGLAAASCFTTSSSPPPQPPPPLRPGLSHVPPLPNGYSCKTIALVPSLIPARWRCLGTMSMKSDSLIQKTCFRAKNLGRVSSSSW